MFKKIKKIFKKIRDYLKRLACNVFHIKECSCDNDQK